MDNQFKYDRFTYEKDEWDNVPSVIPRFMFYIQAYMEKEVEFSCKLDQCQTTFDLKNEIYGQLKIHKEIMDAEEKARKDDVVDLNKKRDDL